MCGIECGFSVGELMTLISCLSPIEILVQESFHREMTANKPDNDNDADSGGGRVTVL